MRALKVAYHALWAVALAAVLAWMYRDGNAPGHDSLILGAHVYAANPVDALWVIAGGLGFWSGMRALSGRLR
jgi:hypothetical protein